jgi:hypothetical protein
MLEQQILKTLEYFDVQDHPLTVLEIHKYLLNIGEGSQTASLLQIEKELQALSGKVETAYGFYYLLGRNNIVKKRLENTFYSTQRLKLEKRFLPNAKFIPFVSAVALTGSEALSNSRQGSDMDLFVLTKPNRIWLARLFLTAYLHARGVRRYGKRIENRFCLNHYIQEGKHINNDQNIYTAMEYISLIPYFGAEAIYNFQINNTDWVKKYLIQPQIIKYPKVQESNFKIFVEKLLSGRLGNWFEAFVGSFQRRKIKIEEGITVEPDELSFHPASKGRQVLEKLSFKL